MKTIAPNVLLTGFRATGKTMVGALVASLLNYRFIDTDQVLCERHRMGVSDFVARNGWQAFRQSEQALLLELVNADKTVVSVGGGAIEHVDVWNKLKEHFFIVWLRATPQTIISRMNADNKTSGQRPSLTGKSRDQEVIELLTRRTPLYRDGSDLILDTDDINPESLAASIVETVIK